MRFALSLFMIRTLAKLFAPIALAGATLGLASNPAQAVTLFLGDYAPANWTQSIQGDGSINISGAPASIVLNGSNDLSGEANTDFTIASPADGTVSFDWAYVTADLPTGADTSGYLLNGVFFRLSNDSVVVADQSGSASFSVLAGDVFGFRQNTLDSDFGRASTTISNFNGPVQSVPGPLPLLGAGAAFGWSRRLRKRIRASGGVNSAARVEG